MHVQIFDPQLVVPEKRGHEGHDLLWTHLDPSRGLRIGDQTHLDDRTQGGRDPLKRAYLESVPTALIPVHRRGARCGEPREFGEG